MVSTSAERAALKTGAGLFAIQNPALSTRLAGLQPRAVETGHISYSIDLKYYAVTRKAREMETIPRPPQDGAYYPTEHPESLG